MPTITERVAAGASLYDTADHGWWREDAPLPIDLAALDMGDPELCVPGQRCPLDALFEHAYHREPLAPVSEADVAGERWRSYAAHAVRLSGLGLDEWLALHAWGVRHGFTADISVGEYPQLTAAWRELIRSRRAEAVTSGE